MTLTTYGKREWMGSGIIAAFLCVCWVLLIFQLGMVYTGWSLMALTVLSWLAIAAFFRVPHRTIPNDESVLVAPADGVIRDIDVVRNHGIEIFEGQELLRIGIFLSILDVHVNRAPADWDVEYRKYREGRFLDARHPRCSKENEALVLAGNGKAGSRSFPLAVRQISGAIARRIVCQPEPGNSLHKGEIYGMIKFGSRTELFIPDKPWIKVTARIGEKVKSGSTVVAKIETGKKHDE